MKFLDICLRALVLANIYLFGVSMFYSPSSNAGSDRLDHGGLLFMKLQHAVNTCRMVGEEESCEARVAALMGVRKVSRGSTSTGRVVVPASPAPPLPFDDVKLFEFATAEAESWGMNLREGQSDGSGIELVLKSPSLASGLLAVNVWGEPVVGATAEALKETGSTLFPLNCSVKHDVLDKEACDQLCLKVPSGSALYYARHNNNQERVVRVPNAKLQISRMGVVSLVALENPIDAGIPLFVAPPVVAISRQTTHVALPAVADAAVADCNESDPFLVHLQMFKVSRVTNLTFTFSILMRSHINSS